MKRKLSLLLVMALGFGLAACAGKNTTPSGNTEKVSQAEEKTDGAAADTKEAATKAEKTEKKFKIGMIHQDLSTEFETYAHAAIVQRCEEVGAELVYFDGTGSVDVQLSQCENAIQQGVDILMFTAQDATACCPIVENCNNAGIPVMCVITDTDNVDEATASVGSDHTDSGILMMEYIAEKLGGKGKICVIEGPFGHSAQLQRQEGIMQVLEKYPDIEIIHDDTANWDRTQAMDLTENWLQSDATEIDAIVCHSDDMAMGALQACIGANVDKDILITGVDGIVDALNSVKDGGLVADIYQDSVGIGTSAVDVAMKILNGEPYEKVNRVPWALITQENVDEYLARFE